MVTEIVFRGTVPHNMEQADSLYNGTADSMDKTIPVTLRLNTELYGGARKKYPITL